MTYGTLAAVKERLQITTTNTDTEITNILTQCDTRINLALKPYTALPLPTTSPYADELAEIENEMAAGIFRYRRIPPSEKINQAFMNEADLLLQAFIMAHFRQTMFRGVGATDQYSNEPWRAGEFFRRVLKSLGALGGAWPRFPIGEYKTWDYNTGTFIIRVSAPRRVLPSQTVRFYAIFMHADDGLINPTSLALSISNIGGTAVTPVNTLIYETLGNGMWYVDVEIPSTIVADKYVATWTGTYQPSSVNVQGGNPGGPYNITARCEFKAVTTLW